jgi:hypothetical protein
VDGDVYLWEPFDETLLSQNLIAQNLEVSSLNHYEEVMVEIENKLPNIPSAITEIRNQDRQIMAFNAGILGGNDLDFINRFADMAFKFVNENLTAFSNSEVSNFNIIFEQYLFYCLSKKEGKEVSLLINEILSSQHYHFLGDFSAIPFSRRYLHLSGNFKHDLKTCNDLADRLQRDFPEHYYWIISMFKNRKKTLTREYFWFGEDEGVMLKKHKLLKNTFLDQPVRLEDKMRVDTNVVKSFELLISKCPSELQSSFFMFLDELKNIVETFTAIDRYTLVQRDLKKLDHFQLAFENERYTEQIKFSVDKLSKTIPAEFNWANVFVSNEPLNLDEVEPMSENGLFILITPECDQWGFSLNAIDSFDFELLEALKLPMSFHELVAHLQSVFHGEANSILTKLILSRLKAAIWNKSVQIFNGNSI